MALLLEPALDLTAIAGCLILLGLLYTMRFTFVQLAQMLDVGIDLGITTLHPFAWLAAAIETTLVKAIETGISLLETALHGLYAGLTWSISEAIALPGEVMSWVRGAFEYLNWSVLHPLAAHLEIGLAEGLALLQGRVNALYADVAGTLDAAEEYARQQAAGAVATAEAFATTLVHGIGDQFLSIANKAEAIAEGAAADVKTIEGDLSPAQLAALVAAIPAALVFTGELATEAGLGSAACRSKVGGICGVPALAWDALLAGLLVTELALTLPVIVELVQGTLGTFEDVIKEFS